MADSTGFKRPADGAAAGTPPAKAARVSFATLPPPMRATVADEDDLQDAIGESKEVFSDEEEDARFLGGGLTAAEAEAIDYINRQEGTADDAEEAVVPVTAIDAAAIKRQLTKVRKAQTKNEKQRAQFGEDPARFMESEAELDTEIRGLEMLSEATEHCSLAVEQGLFDLCVTLLGHENTDIVSTVLRLLAELTEPSGQVEPETMTKFAESMEASGVWPALVQTLDQFEGQWEHLEEALASIAAMVEHVIDIDATFTQRFCASTEIVRHSIEQLAKKASKEADAPVACKQLAAELLFTLMCDTTSSIAASQCIALQGVETILLCLAPYRKKTLVKNSAEESIVADCFNVLCRLVSVQQGKDDFLEQEGVGLMQRFLTDSKAAKESQQRAIEVLDYACGSWQGGAVCAAVVQAGLLKQLFSRFMKLTDQAMQRTLLSIFAAFFRTLHADDPERARVLNKFAEKQHTPLRHLVSLHLSLTAKRQAVQARIVQAEAERPVEMDARARREYDLVNLLQLMDGGLEALQLCDVVLAWLVVQDTAMRDIVVTALKEANLTMESIAGTLKEMAAGLEEAVQESNEEKQEEDGVQDSASEAQQEKEMVDALVETLMSDV